MLDALANARDLAALHIHRTTGQHNTLSSELEAFMKGHSALKELDLYLPALVHQAQAPMTMDVSTFSNITVLRVLSCRSDLVVNHLNHCHSLQSLHLQSELPFSLCLA
jgi:hypothetical protein